MFVFIKIDNDYFRINAKKNLKENDLLFFALLNALIISIFIFYLIHLKR